MNNTIRANASIKWTDGNDGRDGRYYIQYSCPKCGKTFYNEEMGCKNCNIFFDWTKKHI